MNLVFMGTPDFAVPGLEILAGSRHRIVGVVTAPDRPSGRGLRLSASPVKKKAVELSIPILQPDNLKESAFHGALRQWADACFVVVGFRILPPVVYEMPAYGTINLHASLLPKYRGAAPIQWALINGESETGVTTFFIEKKVDTGDVILQHAVKIKNNETAGHLHDRLSVIGADLLMKTVDLIADGKVERKKQTGDSSPAPKLIPELCQIDWCKPANQVVNLIRGLSPYPGAFTLLNDKRLKIFHAVAVDDTEKKDSPGTVVDVSQDAIQIKCGTHSIRIFEVQLEGKKKMITGDFLRGYPLHNGVRLIHS